jgi:rhodanese-like protein
MNKEQIYQIIIGILVGAFIVFVLFTYDISISKKNKGDRNDGGDIVVSEDRPSLNPKRDLSTVPRMTVKELNDKLGDSDVIVLDVRDIGHWLSATEKIKGALREDPTKFESWFEKYSKDKKKTIVTYCD